MERGMPTGGPGRPSSAASSGPLERLAAGAGSVLLVLEGSSDARSERLRGLVREARGRAVEVVELEATPFDREVPYGCLLPWLSQISPLPSGRAPEGRNTPLPLVALAGLWESGGPMERRARAPGVLPAAVPGVERQVVAPEDVRLSLFELVEGRAKRRSALVTIDHGELLDSASVDWLRDLAPRLDHLTLLLAVALPGATTPSSWGSPLAGPTVLRERVPPGTPGGGRSPLAPGQASLSSLAGVPLTVFTTVALAGPDCTPGLIAQTLGLSIMAAEQELRALIDAGWLQEGPTGPLAPSEEERATAVQLMGGAAVARLHRAIAVALEKDHPHPRGRLLFHVADHWEAAGAAANAIPRLLETAAECERCGAPSLAEARLRRALVLAQHEPTAQGRLLEEQVYDRLASVRYHSNDPFAAIEALQRAVALAQARGAPISAWGGYVARMAVFDLFIGADPEPRIREVLGKVEGRYPAIEGALLRARSGFHLSRGRPKEALEDAERAIAIAERGKDPVERIRCRITAANGHLFGGQDSEGARVHLQKVLELRGAVEGTPEQTLIVDALDLLALAEYNLQNYPKALEQGEAAVREARRMGSRMSMGGALGNAAEYALAVGALDRAEELSRELRELSDRYNTPDSDDSRLQLMLVQGLIDQARENPRRAAETFDRLVASAQKGGILYFVAQGLLFHALLDERTGNVGGAKALVGRLRKEGLIKSLGSDNRKRLSELESRLPSGGKDAKPPR